MSQYYAQLLLIHTVTSLIATVFAVPLFFRGSEHPPLTLVATLFVILWIIQLAWLAVRYEKLMDDPKYMRREDRDRWRWYVRGCAHLGLLVFWYRYVWSKVGKNENES